MSNEFQHAIPFGPYSVKDIEDAPAHLVAQCRTHQEAVQLCMRLSHVKRTETRWAEIYGTTRGTFNLLLNGGTKARKRYIDPEKFNLIQQWAGNRAIAQWFDMESRGLLNHQKPRDARIRELEAQLAELKAG